jgi:hypothetical protein
MTKMGNIIEENSPKHFNLNQNPKSWDWLGGI